MTEKPAIRAETTQTLCSGSDGGTADGQPTYFIQPCGSGGTIYTNDKEKTSFHIVRQEDGELTINGARYKKTDGSKTDLKTGETIQFDVLADGSHKETRRFPPLIYEDEDGDDTAAVPEKVLALARQVKALIEKADKAADRAEQLYKSAGLTIIKIKEQSPEDWETIVQRECGKGRSRSYELMAIADGRTTLEKVRAGTNKRQKIHRAKSESVTSRTEPEPVETEEERDRKTCVALYQKVLDAEKEAAAEHRAAGSAETSIDQRRDEMARLDESRDDIVDRAISLVASMDDEQRRQFHDQYIKLYGAA